MRARVTKQVERAVFLLAAVAIFLWGFWQGLNVTAVTFDLLYFVVEVTVLDAVTSSMFFTAFVVVFGGLFLREVYSRSEQPRETDAGTVAAIVPVYKDAAVMENSVASLNDSEYEDVDVYVVCEEDDEESQEAAAELDCEMLLNQEPGSKAGAINTVFEQVDADYYAIFDADETISADFLPAGVGYIEQGYEAFEGRRVPHPTGIVEAFAYCERIIFNIAFKFMEATRFRNVGSSSVILTREAWERTGGYDDMLTEDIDFHHKSFRAAISVAQDRRCTNLMEAPHTWTDFWNQRKRWRMGWVEVLHKTLVGGYDNYLSYRGIISTTRIIMGVIATISLLFLVPKFVLLLLLDLESIFLFPLASLAAVTALASWRDHQVHDIWFLGRWSLLTIVVVPVTGLIALKAIPEYVLTWEGEWYQIAKTGE